jgi:sphingomyelin phosphodiesterase 2
MTRFGITADSPLNTYSAGKPLDQHARKYSGKRLDYIFYRQPARSDDVQDVPILRCRECKVVLTEHVPGYDFSFSDHFGLDATLEFAKPEDAPRRSRYAPSTIDYEPSAQKPSALSIASVTETIQALYACYRFSRRRSRQELVVFVICIMLLLAFVVGSAWLPYQWINPVSLLITIFISWLATTMLYEGFLYGQWERNALTNAIEDLEMYKNAVERQPDT